MEMFRLIMSNEKSINNNNFTSPIAEEIEKIFNKKRIINYKEIQEIVTPIIDDKDIFISYSHHDTNLALEIRNQLEKAGYKTFVDALFWKSMDDAMKIYDNHMCKKNNNKSYDYDKRNRSTAIFHTILTTSIIKVITKCKYFLFIETENSNSNDIESPWIYLENFTSNIINDIKNNKSLTEELDLKVLFDIDLSKFKKVSSINELIKLLGKPLKNQRSRLYD